MRMLRPKEAAAKHGLGRTTFYTRIEAGLIPKLVNLGGRAVGIPEHELVAQLEAAREAA